MEGSHRQPVVNVRYDETTSTVQFVVALADGTGDHVLATLPATPPPQDNPE